MFQPQRGIDNPIIRRAMALCDEAGMKITYHEDSVEVWFAPDNKRFYTIWSQFLADAEAIFGDRLIDQFNRTGQPRAGFGNRGSHPAEAGSPANGHDSPPHLNSSPSHASEIAKLRAEIRLLERAVKVVGMQREEWKREAGSMKEQLELVRVQAAQMVEARLSQAGPGVDRYKMVRQIIVRRLHPDIPGSDEEKSTREKLFKTIWNEIELLDRR